MDLAEFLKKIFSCFIPKMKKTKKTPDKMTHFNRTLFRKYSIQQQNIDTYQSIVLLRTRANYQDMKHSILNGIKFDCSRTLYVWCPEILVPNDFISTLLHDYGDIEHLLDKWNEGSSSPEPGSWAGAVVMYCKKEDAVFAAKDIFIRCRHIKVVSFIDIIPLLADFELLYSWSNRSSSTVLISGSRPLDSKEANSLILKMSCYGQIQWFFFEDNISMDIIGGVSYAYLTQAYLAMMMTGGVHFGIVNLSAKLSNSKRDEEILKAARMCIMDGMEFFLPQSC